ncbi:MAG: hypothetical protein WA817_00385 [Candidatus Acidiferrum sp.]
MDCTLNETDGLQVLGDAGDSGLRVAELGELLRDIAREVRTLTRWHILLKLALGGYVHCLRLLSTIPRLHRRVADDGGGFAVSGGDEEERFRRPQGNVSDEAAVLASWADIIAGTMMKENASTDVVIDEVTVRCAL